ncbi:MAG: hypothetical protein ACOX7R_10700 [Acetivibrionales bacterium]|jgi:hypothetical protein
MIRDILLNKWFYTFVVGWIVFLLLIDWSTIRQNIWSGIAAIGLELWQDASAHNVGMYHMLDRGISLFNVSAFLTFGIVFTMGVLFFQFLPMNPKLQLIHLVVFSIGFMIFEFILIEYGVLFEPHWGISASFFDNIIIMGTLVWLKHFIIYKSKIQ